MITCQDSLEFLKRFADFSIDINYSDPPYALGSEVIVRKDGKVDYAKASDFMNKWDMPTGDWWGEWFVEAYRTLKYGGYCIMFGMDRQLLLFKYYAHLAGFTEKQSMYWYFISNFPKATDLSKMIDKNAGAERNQILANKRGTGVLGERPSLSDPNHTTGDDNAITPLAKKYSGYKYSIAPLKQTNETIMIFQKPYKTGSCLHDTLAMENGNEEITCGALDIDGNRVGTETIVSMGGRKNNMAGDERDEKGAGMLAAGKPNLNLEHSGRYPSQTFVDSQVAEVLDEQGDVSKILHKCDFEKDEHDLYVYQPKVSKAERGNGLDNYITLKYNSSIWNEENMVQAELLKKVISDLELKNFNIDISGENTMVQCHRDFLSTIKTTISEITISQILNSLTHLHTSDSIVGVSSEMESGGSPAQSVKNSKKSIKKTGIGQMEESGSHTRGVANAILKLLSLIKDADDWQELKNNNPCLKPIALNEKILRLFKTPNPQKILYTFAGAGSEVIGGIKAGFDNWEACELSQEYVDIAKARIKHWTKQSNLF